jgi:DnaJ-domain-containing protein 1
VKKIFDHIWKRFADDADTNTNVAVDIDEHSIALRTLRLRSDASQNEITRSYRSLASRYHPDKGGDTETFINVRRAYELLRAQSRV